MTRLLLADDHPMIRTALEVLLRDTDFAIAGMAATGAEALAETERLAPDILLLDLHMPDGNGMEVLRRLRGAGRGAGDGGPRIVLLTAAIDDAALMEARALNVEGMVLKNSDPAYLLHCLDQVRHGRRWTDPELVDRVETISEERRSRVPLAPRERALINLVRQGLKNRDIARELGVTEGTVKTYLHSTFQKLGVKTRTELAIRAGEFLGEEGETS